MKPLLDEIAEALIAADCGDYKTKPMHLYRPLAQAAIEVVERRLLSDEFLEMLEQHGLIPAWQEVKGGDV